MLQLGLLDWLALRKEGAEQEGDRRHNGQDEGLKIGGDKRPPNIQQADHRQGEGEHIDLAYFTGLGGEKYHIFSFDMWIKIRRSVNRFAPRPIIYLWLGGHGVLPLLAFCVPIEGYRGDEAILPRATTRR